MKKANPNAGHLLASKRIDVLIMGDLALQNMAMTEKSYKQELFYD